MKRNIVVISCFCIAALLSGCSSYKEFEDSLRQRLSGNSSGNSFVVDTEYENLANVKESDTAGIGDTLDVYSSLIFKAGDDTVEDGTIQYTLEKVEFLTTLKGTGIKAQEFLSPKKFNADGSLVDADENTLVMLTVKIKNVDINIEDIEEENPLFVEYMAGCESGISNPDGPFTHELDYFSEHPDSTQDYYKYSLEEGQEMEAVLAWVVPGEELEEPFYFIVGSGTGPLTWQYFWLNQEAGNES